MARRRTEPPEPPKSEKNFSLFGIGNVKKEPETDDLAKNDERFAEFETKVGDSFGED